MKKDEKDKKIIKKMKNSTSNSKKNTVKAFMAKY